MTRIALCLLAGCVFDASYDGGHFTCSDGKCPAGLTCIADKCVAGRDAPVDVAHDAHVPALTCADPGVAAASEQGTTSGTGKITATCGGVIMNGPDAVYGITLAAGDHIAIAITGDYAVDAYLIAPCAATPVCEGNMFAST